MALKQSQLFLIALAYSSLFVFGFVDNARGPVFPDLLREFSLSDSSGALFFLTASATALANNVLLFNWIERIGPHLTTRIYSAIQAIGLATIGLSASYPVTVIGAGIVGLSLGGLGISVNLLVSEGAPARIRRQMLSGLHCMYGISSLLAPLFVILLYRIGFDWHAVMCALAAGPFLVFLFTFLRPLEGPGDNPKPKIRLDRKLLPVAMFFGALCTLYVIAEVSIGTRLVLFARREWAFGIETSNQLLAFYFAALFLGRVLFAVVSLPHSSMRILVVSASSGFVCFSLGLLVSPWWLAATGLCFSVFYPCAIALISDEQGPAARPITSTCITLQALGTTLMHFILGWASDAFGLGRALWLGPISLAIVLIMLAAKLRAERKIT